MSTELLTSGPGVATRERLPRLGPWLRRHRLWLIAAAALAVSALAADQWQQQRELNQLTSAIAAGESQVRTTDQYFDGMVAYYSPVIFREAPPVGLRDSFQVDVADGARTGLAATTATEDVLDGITILPWHSHLLAARTAYQDRIVLWQGFLTDVTNDSSALFEPLPDFVDSATSTRAALQRSLPWSSGAAARESLEDALPSTP